MGKLNRKYYDGSYVPDVFGDIIDKAVKDGSLPEQAYTILNSLITGKSPYKEDLEDVLAKNDNVDLNKGKDDTTSVRGILSMIVRLGESIRKLHNMQSNLLTDGLREIWQRFYVDDKKDDNTFRIPYNGNLPSVNDTKVLKDIRIKKGHTNMKLNDNLFMGLLDIDSVSDKYFNAMVAGDTSLNDNFITPISFLYVFYKNIKRRADSVNYALQNLKGGSFKGGKSDLYSNKKIDLIMSSDLQDRKTRLNITAEIRQIVNGSYVTIPEFNVDKKNFLYYRRNTYDLFIDDERTMSFQFLDYKNPTSIEVGETYAIKCRVEDKIYKNCEINILGLGLLEKQASASAFPIVDAYTEFMNMFTTYKEIRDAYTASVR